MHVVSDMHVMSCVDCCCPIYHCHCDGMPTEVLHAFKSFSSSKREEIILEGIELYCKQKKCNLHAVKRFLDEKHKTSICLNTICNHASGEHQNPRKAHESQQLLSPTQENILIDWIILLVETGHCISKRTLQKKAKLVCGQKPSKTWAQVFLSRHPKIILGKPSSLDPKCMQAFNKPTVI